MNDRISGGGQFNTLAQNGTPQPQNMAVILQGRGSDLAAKKTQQGRAKRKLVTQKCTLSMIDICRPGEAGLRKSLWNTFHCQSRIYTTGDRLYGRYCKNRFCTLCCANRKADIINRYLPIIENWPDQYFVTLTVKAVLKTRLRDVIRCIVKELKKIIETYRKKEQRGTGKKLIGIRSLECNFNPERKTYNPHFHIVVAEKWMAEVLINEWIDRSKPGHTNKRAQDLRPVGSVKNVLIEVVKYGSKIFTEPQVNNKIANNTKGAKVYTASLKNIINAIKGVRIFDRFGFNLPREFSKSRNINVVNNCTVWDYKIEVFNWENNSKEKLINYTPSYSLKNLLESNIDNIIE